LHVDLVPPNYLSRNKNHTPTTGIDHGLTLDRRIFPIRPNPAVNRGYIPGTLDSTGRLREFTAACSPLFYRGKALPEAFYGNIFVCEPAGNLIKRNISQEAGLQLTASDPHPGKEFLASTDERFRPVHQATGPDGALYVADMYRGLVQHAAYVTPYLKEQTLIRKLVQPIHYGRIWRIVPENWKPSRPEKLSTASSASLVDRLSHPDGWHRDVVQRLLVERKDKSSIAALQQLVTQGQSHLGRFHALWTLEGLHQLTPDLLFHTLSDSHPLVRSTSLRLLEPMAKRDQQVQETLETHLLKSWEKASIEEILQLSLSASALRPEAAHTILTGIADKYGNLPLIRDAVLSSLPNQEFTFLQKLQASPQWQSHEPAKEIFLEMLATAVLRKGNANELNALLALLNKNNVGWQEKTILTAISVQGNNSKRKPIRLASEPKILARKDVNLSPSHQKAIAALFEWPGHTAGSNSTQKKTLLNESEQKLFALGRQHYLTTCAGCHGTDGAGLNRFAPPLIASEWVLGDEKRLALLVLHGIEGPVEVNGKLYNAPDILPVMPAHSTMDDGAITAILTYIRNEWGNDAGPVSKGLVGSTRHTSQGRVQPWTAKELNQHILEGKASNGNGGK
jgi:mono/diheme cytochrome c family protein